MAQCTVLMLAVTAACLSCHGIAAPVFAGSHDIPPLSATVYPSTYGDGGTVVLTGSVKNYDQSSGRAVTMVVTPEESSRLVHIMQIVPESDGSFEYSFKAGGPLWEERGAYAATLRFGIHEARATIWYTGGSPGHSTPPPAARFGSTGAFVPLCESSNNEYETGAVSLAGSDIAIGFAGPVDADGAVFVFNATGAGGTVLSGIPDRTVRNADNDIVSGIIGAARLGGVGNGSVAGIMLLNMTDTVSTYGLYSTDPSGSPLYLSVSAGTGTSRIPLPDAAAGAANGPKFTRAGDVYELGTYDGTVALAGEVMCSKGWAARGSDRALFTVEYGTGAGGPEAGFADYACDAVFSASGDSFGRTIAGGISENVLSHTITNVGDIDITGVYLEAGGWNETGTATELLGGAATEAYNRATGLFEPLAGPGTPVIAEGFGGSREILYRVNLGGAAGGRGIAADATAEQTFAYSYTCPTVIRISGAEEAPQGAPGGTAARVEDGARITATGSVSLDRDAYPVPFGMPGDHASVTGVEGVAGRSIFPVHESGFNGDGTVGGGEFVAGGDLVAYIRISDPDWDADPSLEDRIAQDVNAGGHGPVKISVHRGSETVVLGYAGGTAARDGTVDVGDNSPATATEYGPIREVGADSGVFEIGITVRFSDGPAGADCPPAERVPEIKGRFDQAPAAGSYCILRGDVLHVEYTDPADASGSASTVTDSAAFELRDGLLQTDRQEYVIGSDVVLTLVEPDFDLDGDSTESYPLDLIEWDSAAYAGTMGGRGTHGGAFDPGPSSLRETGDSTGVFQSVIRMPHAIGGSAVAGGEPIGLEYTDWGPAGSGHVGGTGRDAGYPISASGLGASVELDKEAYTWTDKVHITVTSPGGNLDSSLVDEIGDGGGELQITTREGELEDYTLVETGTDTGVFTGEVILTGFAYDVDGDGSNDLEDRDPSGSGPTDGLIPATDDSGISVSYEFAEDETAVGSALIRWNVGSIQWLESGYPAGVSGTVRVIDSDRNLDPESADMLEAGVASYTDTRGMEIVLTETGDATGVFEGTVQFTTGSPPSGRHLRVSEGGTVTAQYTDRTLPEPHGRGHSIEMGAVAAISAPLTGTGAGAAPLERILVEGLRPVDAFDNRIGRVSAGQQVQIAADLVNVQGRDQDVSYVVHVQDENGVTASLSWLDAQLGPHQRFGVSQSWTPAGPGTYTVTAFAWESFANPAALSPPATITVPVA